MREVEEMDMAEYLQLRRYDGCEPLSVSHTVDATLAGLKHLFFSAHSKDKRDATDFLVFAPKPPKEVDESYILENLKRLGFKDNG